MTIWRHIIELYDLFHENEDKPFTDLRDGVCDRLAASAAAIPEDLIDDLRYTQDEDEFDEAWQYVYDWADSNRVWLNAVFPPRGVAVDS